MTLYQLNMNPLADDALWLELMQAIDDGDAQAVADALKRDADPLRKGTHMEGNHAMQTRTAIEYAVLCGDAGILEQLLQTKWVQWERKISPGLPGFEQAPLWAMEAARADMLTLFAQHGLDVNKPYGEQPLLFEAIHRDAEESHGKEWKWITAGEKGERPEAACPRTDAVMEAGADIKAEFRKDPLLTMGITPLGTAIERQSVPAVEKLIAAGAPFDVPTMNNNLKTTDMLELACMVSETHFSKRSEAIVRLLYKQGANVDTSVNNGQPLLCKLVEKNRQSAVHLLWQLGADFEIRAQPPAFAYTPLEIAVGSNEFMIGPVLGYGANPNAKSRGGERVIHRSKNLDAARQLIRAGADAHDNSDKSSFYDSLDEVKQALLDSETNVLRDHFTERFERFRQGEEDALFPLAFDREGKPTQHLNQACALGVMPGLFTPDLWRGHEAKACQLFDEMREKMGDYWDIKLGATIDMSELRRATVSDGKAVAWASRRPKKPLKPETPGELAR